MPISALEFAEFLAAHNPNYRCPYCGHGEFHMNVQTMDLVADLAVPVKTMGVLAAQSITHNFNTVSCQRCGHTSWFHVAAVQRWLEQRGSAKRLAEMLMNDDKR